MQKQNKPFHFEPEDFIGMDWENDLAVRTDAAREANAKLKQWLAEAPTVHRDICHAWTIRDKDIYLDAWIAQNATHKAKLVQIEELSKENDKSESE